MEDNTTTSTVTAIDGMPRLTVNGETVAPVAGCSDPPHITAYDEAGIELLLCYMDREDRWWIGPERYDFSGTDRRVCEFRAGLESDSTATVMLRFDLRDQATEWWPETYPDEVNHLIHSASGEPVDQQAPNPSAVRYLGHEVDLSAKSLHSLHSLVWRAEMAAALAELTEHVDTTDYSPAAKSDFRRWLRRRYGGDPAALSAAWGLEVSFDSATIPSPSERDAPVEIARRAKDGMRTPKVVAMHYGYQCHNHPRPHLTGHYSLRRLLDSGAIDIVISPHTYGCRGEGGYHAPQAMVDTIRREGKLRMDAVDIKTVWMPRSVTLKPFIRTPMTAAASVELMKKSVACAMSSRTDYWWMDLTRNGWFDAPEAVAAMDRLRTVYYQQLDRPVGSDGFGEVALVTSHRSMMFQAPREGLHNACLGMFRD